MFETLLAFIWAPVALYLLALGAGLLAERLTRVELPDALLAPLGLAIVVVITMSVFRLGLGAAVAVPVTALIAIAGLVLSRASLPARAMPTAAGLAALGAYALYLAPVALSGHWTWAGYNFVNDTSSNFIFADLLFSGGVTETNPKDSTTAAVASSAGGLGYPLGSHGLVAVGHALSGAQIAAVYQPVIAFVAAMGAMSLTHLAARAGLRTLPAAAAGVLAVGAGLIYRYALHGGIKEIVVVALLSTAAALAWEALERRLQPALVALVAVCLAALLHAFGAVSVAYGLALGATMLGASLLWPERAPVKALATSAAAGIAAFVVASAASLAATVNFGRATNDAFDAGDVGGTAFFGHLLRPIPIEQGAGVWLARDYRGPVPPGLETENAVLIAVVLLLGVIGIALELRRRRPGALLLFAAAAVPGAVLASRLSPYADSKFLVVLSPAVVLLAAVGALGLLQVPARAARILGGIGACLLALGVLWSAALGYHSVRLAPPDRMEAMADAAEHARGGGLWLFNEWEEYAKFFMRDIRVNPAFESESPRSADLRKPAPIFGRYYDLDAERIRYSASFPGIIKRRSPDASRPPASYLLTYSNAYYEVWRRRSGVRVRAHLPLQRLHRATDVPSCAAVRRMAGRAAAGEQVIAASGVETIQLDTAHARDRPPSWPPDLANPGLVAPQSPGKVSAEPEAPAGRYRAWVRGSFGRPVTVRVGGREVGKAGDVNSPGQWLEVGEVRLEAGGHRLELERPGGWISPGNGYAGEFGPLALEPLASRRLVNVPPREATNRLCGKRWDWIELVSGDV